MSRIVDVPAQFDEQGFDQLAQSIGVWPPSDRIFFDARGVQWAAPYALIGLLTAAQAIIEAGGEKPLLAVPTADDVRSYWGRIAFFQHAGELFEFHGKLPKARGAQPADTLLEITPVRATEDVHEVVGRIQEEGVLFQSCGGRRLPGGYHLFRNRTILRCRTYTLIGTP